MKKHFFSAHSDLKTGFLCKLFIGLGIILVVLYALFHFTKVVNLGDDVEGALLAFAILSLGLGGIMYFFACQFSKLSQIADDVEQDESLLDEEEKVQKT